MLHAPLKAWASLIYLSVVSQFLAYVAWYSGMAMGGIARVSQVQYLQPFLMILFAALFLGETITLFTLAIAIIVVFSVVIGKNASVSKKEVHPQKMVNKDA
jgi:drug/metabolite transporter (DMT)-like permease